MRGIFLIAIILALAAVNSASAETRLANNIREINAPVEETSGTATLGDYRGWEYLAARLTSDGIPEARIAKVYKNKKMPPFEQVYFKLNPREGSHMYSNFKNKELINSAAVFIKQNKKTFDQAESKYKVSRSAIASILLIETRFGKNTGKEIAINRLSRIASIGKPENVLANFEKLSKEDSTVTFKQVEARAKYLEEKFYPEILALFEIGRRNNLDPLSIRGSGAGAFGIPQFLPSTYLRFAVDGNKDGKVSLYSKSDAIFSVAHFLADYGWRNNAPRDQKEFVIWNYNQSDAYVESVLYVADKLAETH